MTDLPTVAALPFPAPTDTPWHKFPIGVGEHGARVWWSPTDGGRHLLVTGAAGAGKTVQVCTILEHALQSPDWTVSILDRRTGLSDYAEADGCVAFASSYEEVVRVLRLMVEEAERRLSVLAENRVQTWFDLPDQIVVDGKPMRRPPAALLVIEELIDLLSPIRSAEVDAMKDEARALLRRLCTRSATGVAVVAATLRPEGDIVAEVFGGTGAIARAHFGPWGWRDMPVEVREELEGPLASDGYPRRIPGRGVGVGLDGNLCLFQGYINLPDVDGESAGDWCRRTRARVRGCSAIRAARARRDPIVPAGGDHHD